MGQPEALSLGWLNRDNSHPCVDGIITTADKPRGLIKKAKPAPFFAVCCNANSVGKTSFYVGFIQRTALGLGPTPTPLGIQTGRRLLFTFVIILNLWKYINYIA